ncbi:GTPase IMAP family member 8-like [Denticeps clupeoides]|uniref:GTPase IMAP family member 8-like n=1 Tax=Denticeps clupeoides TaxID=299321 RepID=UPI0010A3A05E|nr:GTPase IMAP family member 8-like [Denticeps clupeoides]XP_028836210.1 GTPase IMAP family member 8-like [Denticeps clupeoides]XP_028836219.1 GTPase IMAP family member 8-like [Denticeps clupeoides]
MGNSPCGVNGHNISSDNKIKIVLIGRRYAGKNIVGNTMLGKNVFRSCLRFGKRSKGKGRVGDKKVTVFRINGWSGDLSMQNKKQKKIRKKIVETMMKQPNALIWIVPEDDSFPQETMDTLESLLNTRVWDYTLLLFTTTEDEDNFNFDTHIRSNGLRETVDKFKDLAIFNTAMSESGRLWKTLQEMMDGGRCFEMSPVTHRRRKMTQHGAGSQQSRKDENAEEMVEHLVQPQVSACLQQRSDDDVIRDFGVSLVKLLNELSCEEFKRFSFFLSRKKDPCKIPKGRMDVDDRTQVAELMLKSWPEDRCIINTRDILKDLPRNDLDKELEPYLSRIGESW